VLCGVLSKVLASKECKRLLTHGEEDEGDDDTNVPTMAGSDEEDGGRGSRALRRRRYLKPVKAVGAHPYTHTHTQSTHTHKAHTHTHKAN
jgi:hypothetical protein